MAQPLDGLGQPPVIGQRYAVGGALLMLPECYRSLHPLLAREHWWPYRGRMHTDPDFQAYQMHLHIEARVLNEEEQEAISRAYEKRERTRGLQPQRPCAPYMIPLDRSAIRGYASLVRECLRHDVTLENELWTDAATSDLLAGDPRREKWRLGKRRLCPHHGFDLRSILPDGNGCTTCPLHQLKYDGAGTLIVSERARKWMAIKRDRRQQKTRP